MIEILRCIYFFIVGSIAGVSMGSIGIGAGLITMPLLIYGGLTIKQAVGAAMVMQLLPQSIPGVINYKKHILWFPSLLVILGSIYGIWLGSNAVKKKYLTEQTLYRIITIFLFITSVYFYFTHWNHTSEPDILE